MHNILSVLIEGQFTIARGLGVAAVEGDSAQQCIDASIELGKAKGFGQIVVGATSEATDSVLLGTQRRH
ncbi:hypothetical protein D3C77_597490 [compost metagenome]